MVNTTAPGKGISHGKYKKKSISERVKINYSITFQQIICGSLKGGYTVSVHGSRIRGTVDNRSGRRRKSKLSKSDAKYLGECYLHDG